MDQLSFSDAEHNTKRKRIRREVFLEEMNRAVPWAQLESIIEPFYPKAGNGRRPYPQTQIQLCIVHQVRHSLRYVSWKQRKEVAADLRLIYGAATLNEAEQALEEFAAKWDSEQPILAK